MVSEQFRGVGFMLISTSCFAVVNTCVKFLGHLPIHELVLFRSQISIVLCLWGMRKLQLPYFGKNKTWLWIRGITGVIALTLFFYTLQNLPMATAITIQYLSPVFTILIAVLFFGEKVKPLQIPFFVLALIGIFVLKGFDPRTDVFYLILGIASAFFSGIAYNAIRKCKDTDHPINVVFYFPFVALPVMGIWCLFDFTWPQGWDWLLILFMGVFTQIAQICMTKALQKNSTSMVTPIKYVGAIYAIAIGSFVFDEYFTWINAMGVFLVICGLLGNTLFAKR